MPKVSHYSTAYFLRYTLEINETIVYRHTETIE